MEILFATSNKHKVAEASEVGKRYGIAFNQIHVSYPEIRSDNVAEVAKAGAEHVYSQIKKPMIVEDSGILINSLNDFPGTYSRFAFERIGNKGILKLMNGIEDRQARFVSAVAYISEVNARSGGIIYPGTNTETKIFEGVVDGRITLEERGAKGFGFDPIFLPKGYAKTFAEDPKTKNAISHRKIAFEKLCQHLKPKPA